MDYQEQYQNYLAQAMAALEKACGRFLPEESEVCRAANGSVQFLFSASAICWAAVCRRHSILQLL